MTKKTATKPKRRTWNTHPRQYGRGKDRMFTARVSKEKLEKIDQLRGVIGLTREEVLDRAINLMESEV